MTDLKIVWAIQCQAFFFCCQFLVQICLEGCDIITLMTCLIPLCCISSQIGQWTHNTSPTIPAIFSLVTLTFCPESPKYLLVNKSDDDAAEAALIWLRKTSDVSERWRP
uniref:Major facilitator superfamily (MFS) profile domain-containing protein n=1 Tax=Biomphalaria glabrata TaxID=6526 RepID=A0A2C9LLI0_BIOGL